MTLIPAARPGTCPNCGEQIVWQRWAAVDFYCPRCGVGLTIRRAYLLVPYGVALFLIVLGIHAIGLRGLAHLVVVSVCALPLYWLLAGITIRLFPVDLVESGDFLGVLYGDRPDERAPDPDYRREAGQANAAVDAPANGAPRFRQLQPPRTIDGALLSAGAVALTAYLVWHFGTSALHWMNPSLVETRYASRGFDLRAELGPTAIAFTNMSTEDWTCEAAVGPTVGSGFRTAFPLAAQETKLIPYGDFRPSHLAVEPETLRSLARNTVWVTCNGPSGRSYYSALN